MAEGDTLYFYYFIGRLNPPHSGHIEALRQLCAAAKSHGTRALIILGSGAKNEPRTKNPIGFELKKDFITTKLVELGFEPEVDFTMGEMTSGPFSPIFEQLQALVWSREKPPTNIEINLYVGAKEDDASKLSSVNAYAQKMAQDISSTSTVDAKIIPIEAIPSSSGEPMSATQVREDAYDFFLNGPGFEPFNAKYGYFYGPTFTKKVYDDMISQMTESIEEEYAKAEEGPPAKKLKAGSRRRKPRSSNKKRKPTKKRYRNKSRKTTKKRYRNKSRKIKR